MEGGGSSGSSCSFMATCNSTNNNNTNTPMMMMINSTNNPQTLDNNNNNNNNNKMFLPLSWSSTSSNNNAQTQRVSAFVPQSNTNNNDLLTTSTSKAKIMAHPLFPRLLAAYVNCQKVGAPPEVVARLEQACAVATGSCRAAGRGDDPALDQFMEAYCEMLTKYEQELTKPFKEAMLFFSRIESQLKTLAVSSDGFELVGQNECSKEIEVDMNENYIDPQAEEKELKGQLLRKYSGYLGSLKQEFLKKKKNGKLPKEARQQLLDWWSRHYKWPYPSESQKVALAESTGLDLKQINNWFINQSRNLVSHRDRNSIFPGELPRQNSAAANWMDFLWLDEHQRNFPYLLDHYYTSAPRDIASYSGDIPEESSELMEEMNSRVYWMPPYVTQRKGRYEDFWKEDNLEEDRSQTHLGASTSATHLGASTSSPIIHESIFRHQEPNSVNPGGTKTRWWDRNIASRELPQTSFMDPPDFNRYTTTMKNHYDNVSERSSEEQQHMEWSDFGKLSRATYLEDIETGELDLHFGDVYSRTPETPKPEPTSFE